MYENLINWFIEHYITNYENLLTPEIKTLYDNILIGNIDQSINNNIKYSNYYNFLGLFFQYDIKYKNYDLMKKYYLMAIDMCDSDAMTNLGNFYNIEKNYDLMKKYYLMAIEQNNSYAMTYLGNYYQIEKNYDLMKKYYLMAIEQNNSSVINDLIYYYHFIEKKYYLMKKYFLIAVKNKNYSYNYNLYKIHSYYNFIYI